MYGPPKSGKSTFALLLAGRRAAIVDVDLRASVRERGYVVVRPEGLGPAEVERAFLRAVRISRQLGLESVVVDSVQDMGRMEFLEADWPVRIVVVSWRFIPLRGYSAYKVSLIRPEGRLVVAGPGIMDSFPIGSILSSICGEVVGWVSSTS